MFFCMQPGAKLVSGIFCAGMIHADAGSPLVECKVMINIHSDIDSRWFCDQAFPCIIGW